MQKNTIEYKFDRLEQELINQGWGPVKPTSNGYRCFCPYHNDTGRPNLDISISDDKIIMHCKSCGANGLDVVNKLDLDVNVLWETNMSNKVNFEKMWKAGVKKSSERRLELWVKKLNTSIETLKNYGCYYDMKQRQLCYPEFDFEGSITGVSYRKANGVKKAMTGAHRGLCLPRNEKLKPHLFITEGLSDCLALSWFLRSERKNIFQVIARPSKTTRFHELLLYVDRIKPKKIRICPDIDDNAGIDGKGAEALECDFLHMGYDADVIWPKDDLKDVRESIQNGVTKEYFVRRDG